MSRPATPKHVLCVSNQGYRASLIVRRVYAMLPDDAAEEHGLLRVIDESGEDYLFPEALFVAIELPRAATRALREEPANPPLQRAAPSRRR
jgi:hypothetical protein